MPTLKATKPYVTPARLKVIEAARERLKDYEELFPDRLKRWGGVDRVEDLTASGYNRLIDFLTLAGFRHRRHPILSRQTRDLIHHAYCDLRLSHHAFETDLRRAGRVGDVLDLNGDGLLSLMEVMEHRGVDLDAFKAARRSLTPQQLRLLGMARKAVEIADARYYAFLQTYGGVNTASDLDQRGFEFMMLYLEYEGFIPTRMEQGDPSLANRLGFATPKQLRLIETLWSEWAANGDGAALKTWLERSYGVSALRFLTAANASKAITALKAMKGRAA